MYTTAKLLKVSGQHLCRSQREAGSDGAPRSISEGSPRQPRREAPRSVKLSFPGKRKAEWEGKDFKSDQKPIAMHKALD